MNFRRDDRLRGLFARFNALKPFPATRPGRQFAYCQLKRMDTLQVSKCSSQFLIHSASVAVTVCSNGTTGSGSQLLIHLTNIILQPSGVILPTKSITRPIMRQTTRIHIQTHVKTLGIDWTHDTHVTDSESKFDLWCANGTSEDLRCQDHGSQRKDNSELHFEMLSKSLAFSEPVRLLLYKRLWHTHLYLPASGSWDLRRSALKLSELIKNIAAVIRRSVSDPGITFCRRDSAVT
jgi:hypothetical protein